MNAEIPNYSADTVVLIDNATWHVTQEVYDTFARNNMSVCFTAPYSFASSPVELVFSRLKSGELNPERLHSGKK